MNERRVTKSMNKKNLRFCYLLHTNANKDCTNSITMAKEDDERSEGTAKENFLIIQHAHLLWRMYWDKRIARNDEFSTFLLFSLQYSHNVLVQRSFC